ncbi:MAG: metallophosphoesterase family protein [Candidatus Helarchaeota archaeon]
MIRVACVSDVHSPRFLELFRKELHKLNTSSIDLFLFAGDMIYKGKVEELNNIIAALEEVSVKFPVYSCFGNEEYNNLHDELRRIGKTKFQFLNDEVILIERKNKTIGIIGTKGSLAQPTWWQSRNLLNIRETYKRRIKKIKDLLENLTGDIRILLFHYAPTYLTVVGEPKRSYPQMGTNSFEKILINKNYKIDAVFHGHAHKGRKFALIKNRIPVYNVAFPLRKKILIIELPKPPRQGSLISYLND